MTTGGTISHSTAPAALALASGGHFTVSGSGRYKHGTFTKLVPACNAFNDDANVTLSSLGDRWSFTAAAQFLFYPIVLDVGQRLLSVILHSNFTTGATKKFSIFKCTSGGTNTEVEELTTTSSTGWAARTFNFTDLTLASGETYYLGFESGAASDQVGGLELSYDYP